MDSAKHTAGCWNCKRCTFLNNPGGDSCSMCGEEKTEKRKVPALTEEKVAAALDRKRSARVLVVDLCDDDEDVSGADGDDESVDLGAVDTKRPAVKIEAAKQHHVDLCDDEESVVHVDDDDDDTKRPSIATKTAQEDHQQPFAVIDLTGDDGNDGSAYCFARELATTLNHAPWRQKSLRELQQERSDWKIAKSLQQKTEARKRARHESVERSDEALARRLQEMQEEDETKRSDEKLARSLQELEEAEQEARRKAKAEEEVFDVLSEHRNGIQQLLRDKAQGLRIVSVDANPHSLVGTRLYNRFVEAWQQVADQTVTLAFHGTAEANIESICEHGLDPKRRSGQAMGPGEYFARQALTSVGYCKTGKKMLVVALLTDRSGLTAANQGVLVINKPEHQLPLFTITFTM